MRNILALSAIVAGVSAHAGLISVYDFNDTLDAAFAANGDVKAMTFHQGTANPADIGNPTYMSDTVGATTKQVAQFDQTQDFRVDHGVPSNGGGGYGNIYSILFDIKTTQRSGASGWMSLYNTTAVNANDGDAFIQNAGLGISGDYAGGWTDNVWTRVVMTVDLTQPTAMNMYVNGTWVNSIDIGPGVDGRWALYTTQDNDSDGDHVWLFMDNDGDNGAGYVSQIAFWDEALSANQVADLGRVGEAVPEPFTLGLLAAGAALAARRKKA